LDKAITYVGLDVHKDTIAVALAEAGVRGDVGFRPGRRRTRQQERREERGGDRLERGGRDRYADRFAANIGPNRNYWASSTSLQLV
jgi:hypothetical protein